MASALGECSRRDAHGQFDCKGDLYLTTAFDAARKKHLTRVFCSRCEAEQPGHPECREIAPEVVPAREIKAVEMVATVPDRVATLERQLQDLLARVVMLEQAGHGGRKGK